LPNLTSAGALATVGTITTGVWNGTPIGIAFGGTGQTTAASAFNALNPMTTTGDTIYEASAGVAARLPIGSSGQVLTVVSGIPAWATITLPTLSSLGIRAGQQAVSSGATTQTSYAVQAIFVNTTDALPQFQPITVTVQSATGFTVTWDDPTTTANYKIQYIAILNS
jgi:hypothetical protein